MVWVYLEQIWLKCFWHNWISILVHFIFFSNYLEIGDCKTCLHLSSVAHLLFWMEPLRWHFVQKQNVLWYTSGVLWSQLSPFLSFFLHKIHAGIFWALYCCQVVYLEAHLSFFFHCRISVHGFQHVGKTHIQIVIQCFPGILKHHQTLLGFGHCNKIVHIIYNLENKRTTL